MGCDIHLTIEVKKSSGEWVHPPIDTPEELEYRDYSIFGWLADVRNYSGYTPIAHQGIPSDCSQKYKDELEQWEGDGHSHSWILASKLLDFNLDQEVEDLRVGKQVTPNSFDGSWQAPRGQGRKTTYRKEFGSFIDSIKELVEKLGEKPENVRLCFFFDN